MAEIKIIEGNDLVIKYTVTDQDNAAVNLTSATILWVLKENEDSTAELTKTTSNGISITNAAGGIFEVTLTDTDTTDLAGTWYMEATITDSNGKVYTISDDDVDADKLIIREIYAVS